MEDGQKKFAFQIFSWVLYAARRLTIDELCEALSVTGDSKSLRKEVIPLPDSIITCCESLVEVDKTSQEVRFTHQTVDEFLRGHCTKQMLSNDDLAQNCLIYLGFSEFDKPCQYLWKRFENYRFSRYAVESWGLHMHGAGERRVEVRKRLCTAFKSMEREHSLHQLRYSESHPYYLKANGLPFLHILAIEGLAEICKMYLDDDLEEMRRYVMISIRY